MVSEITDQKRSENVASFSRTMPIALDELGSPAVPPTGSTMSLTLRGGAGNAPKAISIEQNTYTIGRQEDCDIHIEAPSVSRQHARIFYLHDEEIIEDLGSTNGTFVNGVRVTRCVLLDNDIIRVGDATILFSCPPRKSSSAD